MTMLRPNSKLFTREYTESGPLNAYTIGGVPPVEWVGKRVRVRWGHRDVTRGLSTGVLEGMESIGTAVVRFDRGTRMKFPVRMVRACYGKAKSTETAAPSL